MICTYLGRLAFRCPLLTFCFYYWVRFLLPVAYFLFLLQVGGQLDVAKTRENMAIIYQDQGHYDQALEIYKSVLETKMRVGGHEHPDVASSYSNIGVVYRKKGQYERALEYYQKALEIDIKVSGQDHLDVAKSYNNIGLVYHTQGKYEEALEYYQKSLDIKIRVVGRPPGRDRIIYQHRRSV